MTSSKVEHMTTGSDRAVILESWHLRERDGIHKADLDTMFMENLDAVFSCYSE
jgi:hypothetical protein